MDGLYYLVNETLQQMVKSMKHGNMFDLMVSKKSESKAMCAQFHVKVSEIITKPQNVGKTTLWHRGRGMHLWKKYED